jgi:hypothetical protein
MNEHLRWVYEQKCLKVVNALRKNGFTAVYCATRQEAYENIISEAQNAVTVGFGGSISVEELELIPELNQMGKAILQHNRPGLSPEEQLDIRHSQLSCDLFLTGSNAVTMDGKLVNIDGIGNRVAAMTFGPRKVVVVAGRNKITENVDAALKRIQYLAAPANAHRLNKQLPCAVTGSCSDCNSPERICRITVIIDHMPLLSDITVLIVNDDMGY